MRGLTLRTRATLLTTVLSGLVLICGAVGLTLTLQAQLTVGADDLARSRIQDLLSVASEGTIPEGLTNVSEDGVAQVVADDGTVLAASPNIEGRPSLLTRDLAGDVSGAMTVLTVRGPDDAETETYRLWTASGNGPGGRVQVYVGTSLESVRETTLTLRRALIVGVPLALVVLAASAWLVIGSALRRLDRIRAEVDDITEDRLDRRVSQSDVDDEVGRLAATMNRMLTRLDAAAHRQRNFLADVSHDLQSPLASQRTMVEVALATERSVTEELGRALLTTTDEMERLVGDLLVLAAADANTDAFTDEQAGLVDLDVIVLEEAASARGISSIWIDTSAVSAAPARARDADLRRIVRNLLDNATTHATTRVDLRLSADADNVGLDVLDDGPGIPDEERDRVFERFHRADPARPRQDTRHRAGNGLGLAIARTLAEKLGGTVNLIDKQADLHGAHFRLRLPRPAPTSPVDEASRDPRRP